MGKVAGLLLVVFIVAVSGQEYVLMKQEVQYAEPHETRSNNEVAKMIQQLAKGIHLIQKLSTVHDDENFMCLACKEMMTYIYNVSCDKALLGLVQKCTRMFVCTYMSPAGLQTYCNDYVDDLPRLVTAFADSYLKPEYCAALAMCQSSELNEQLNVLINIVKTMDGTP